MSRKNSTDHNYNKIYINQTVPNPVLLVLKMRLGVGHSSFPHQSQMSPIW